MKRSNDSGLALLSTLILLSLLAALVGVSTTYIETSSREYSDYTVGRRLRDDANSSALDALGVSPSGPAIECFLAHIGSGIREISRTVCTRRSITPSPVPEVLDGRLLHPNLFPVIDFVSLFTTPSHCATFPNPSTFFSLGGHRLTASSARSSNYCSLLSAPTGRLNAFVSNLTLTGPSEIGVDSYSTTLAVSGYLEADAGIRLTGHTLIVAGGDINISEISSDGSHSLTLFSTTGTIRINSIQGSLPLRVSAPLGIYLPSYTQESGNLVLPPTNELQVLGIFRDE